MREKAYRSSLFDITWHPERCQFTLHEVQNLGIRENYDWCRVLETSPEEASPPSKRQVEPIERGSTRAAP